MNSYATNAEYLNDCIAFLELLRPHALREGPPSNTAAREATRITLLEIYSDIRAKARLALRCGVNIPLEKIAAKNALDDVETLMIWIALFASVYGDSNLTGTPVIRKMVVALNKLDPIASLHYWLKDAKLFDKKILTVVAPLYRSSKSDVVNEIVLDRAVLNRLLGKKGKRIGHSQECWSPVSIHAKLSDYVVGQDDAKRTIATAVYKHLKICKINRKRKGVDKIQKANILLIGQTGTGKTHLCRTLAKVLDIPIVICDATQYTETGYVGGTVDEMVVDLYAKAGKELLKMGGGIIYIDEIDKIAAQNVGLSHNSRRDVSGLSVQQELLKLLDGDVLRYKDTDYDISNILFIAGGAFAGLEETIRKRTNQKQIGFGGESGVAANEPADALRDVTAEDVVAYGFTPEFVGRFADITALDPLGKDELLDILTKPKNCLLSQYQELFKASGIALQMPASALEWVAAQALRNKTGARGLKAILEKNLSPILFDQAEAPGVRDDALALREVAFEPPQAQEDASLRHA